MRLGLFDSGVGGLTVLRAIRDEFPVADLVYLGDTARVPYGTKSDRSIQRYADQAVQCLTAHKHVDAVIIACNTASALATDVLRAQFPDVQVFSVIEPGAAKAVELTRQLPHPSIGILATESTVRGGAYTRAVHQLAPTLPVLGQPCQMLVALAEEGWTDGEITDLAVERYLGELRGQNAGVWPTAIVLGCTHFPLLKQTVRKVADRLGAGDMSIVDSSTAIAQHLRQALGQELAGGSGSTQYMATDGPERFANIGSRFLGTQISAEDVEIVDLHV